MSWNLPLQRRRALDALADERATLTTYVLLVLTRSVKSLNSELQLIYKVRNGSSVEDAVEEIVARGVGELRKNAFGEDGEDAKELPWTRAQAWGLMKRLAKEGEVWISLTSLIPSI